MWSIVQSKILIQLPIVIPKYKGTIVIMNYKGTILITNYKGTNRTESLLDSFEGNQGVEMINIDSS
mgnify:CR=1 FL=1